MSFSGVVLAMLLQCLQLRPISLATTAHLVQALIVLFAQPARGHALSSLTTPILTKVGRPLVHRPRVLLFLHIPKCGGTTVRQIFRTSGWYMTLWSLTQRQQGWKANRILHSIRNALVLNKSRIFVEWHIGLNFSFVPELAAHVRTMRPGVRFAAFTLLRQPSNWIASNGAFWRPSMSAALWIRLSGERMLRTLLDDDTGHLYVKVDGGSLCAPSGTKEAFCRRVQQFHAVLRMCGRRDANPRAWERCTQRYQIAFDSSMLGDGNITMNDTIQASADVGDMVGWQSTRDALGCEALVSAALSVLEPMHVFVLEDSPWQAVLAVARGDNLTFKRPSHHMADTFNTSWMPRARAAASDPQYLEQYRTPAAVALSREENRCTAMLIERVRQRIGDVSGENPRSRMRENSQERSLS